MKHLKLFFALFAMLALGVGNAWGAEQTVKWTATSGALGNGIGSGTIKTGTYAWNYTRTLISGSSYTGWSSSCIQLGKNGGVENITFTTSAIPGTIKSVSVECSSYNNAHKVSIAVGGTTYLAATATAKWTTVGTKTGTGSSTGTINISFIGGKRALYIKSITVVYEETSSGGTEPVLSSIEISGDLTKKTYEEGDELDLAGLTVNAIYDDASTKVVTNDVEWSYTPNPLTQGTTSVDITASYEEKTVTKTITGLTVNEHIVTPDEYCIVPNNAFWGTNYNGSDANAATTLSGTQNDISILHTKSGSNLYVNNTQTRVYTDHAMQISVPLGYVITSIAFTADGSNWAGTHTANVGTMTDSKNWAGIANEVTITFGGTCRITKICVNYIKDAKYVLTITEPTEGGTLVVKDGENTLTSGAEIYEGTKLTVTVTPETGYEDGVVVVKNASDEDITATVYADGVLTMPAYAVTISATFEKKPCELLAKPTVSAETTYSSAKLTWEAVANAAKYSVKVGTAEAVVTTETSYEVTGLTAETEYAYQVQAIAEAEQDTYCDSEVAEGSFTTSAAPVVTLTLKDIAGTTTKTGALNSTITLPDDAATCTKTFVGWDADENCNRAPTYAPGAEYTLTAENKTLYAVYADGEGGGNFTITKTMSEIVSDNGYTVSSGSTATCYTSLTLDENITLSTTGSANCGSFWSDPREWRLYQNKSGNAIVTATNGCSLTSVKFTFSYSNTGTLLNNGAAMKSGTAVSASGTSATYTVGNSGSATNGQIRITAIEVSYSKEGEYSNYSTTCAAALEKPTFSVEEGTYTESKSIELNATEGDIYYTLDGTEPTKSSTPYTAAIDLDECGTTTIKAIAISTESQSPVASATYTINLPITNTEATAYTPAEAIAIIDGECDKTEEVFVKGVVVSTSAFSAEYGNYDVIVKAVDDNSATPTTFTFYRMYKAADKTKFTASDEVIGVGDIITAKGVLKKFNSTYELAEGCYMVERVAYTEPKTDISNTLETAYTVDKAFELISDIKSDLDKEVYVKGLVAVASTELYEEKYLTYSISDNGQTTGNVLKVYDGLDINGVAFTSKDDVKVGDYVVVKGKLLNYKGTYEINKDNQLVEHISAATITIADITMEVGETKTIFATVEPAGAVVTYTIKENAANAISLDGNTITALAEGTATITATVAEGATYLGNSVDFTVTVGPKTESDEVVILAEHNGQWYALKAEDLNSDNKVLAALAVTYFNGTLYNVNESDKISITWTRTVVGDQVTFKNGTNYLYVANPSKTELSLNATAFSWTYDAVLDTYTSNNGARTFLYSSEANGFKNFAINNNVGTKNYSGYPVVTAPVYATGDIVYTRTVKNGNYGTICLPYASSSYSGAEFYEVSWLKAETGLYLDQLAADAQLEAGKPYIFRATSTEIKVTCTGAAVAAPVAGVHGLTGTFEDIAAGGILVDNYIIAENNIWIAGTGATLPAYRAYIANTVPKTEQAKLPGRRRVCMGENAETGVDNIITTDAPVKVIENGQLIIIRNGEKFNVQGQKL